MPMKKDPAGGSTNADSSKSVMYCSYCYQSGAFIGPADMTATNIQKFCIGKLKEMKFTGFLAWLMTRNIPNLERWKK